MKLFYQIYGTVNWEAPPSFAKAGHPAYRSPIFYESVIQDLRFTYAHCLS